MANEWTCPNCGETIPQGPAHKCAKAGEPPSPAAVLSMETPAPASQRPPVQAPPPPLENTRLQADHPDFVMRLENAGLKARVAELEANSNGYQSAARFRDALAKAQPVIDAALAWYEAQTHTPLSSRMKARTVLCKAIDKYRTAQPTAPTP